jgi:hypothetical protein
MADDKDDLGEFYRRVGTETGSGFWVCNYQIPVRQHGKIVTHIQCEVVLANDLADRVSEGACPHCSQLPAAGICDSGRKHCSATESTCQRLGRA